MRFNLRKYHNKTRIYDGMKFDSDLEGKRYLYLRDLQEQGVIRGLRMQVEYELVPKQYEEVVVHLKTKDKVVSEFREHPVTYKADFVYEIVESGEVRIEDTKGFKTKDYIIKRKLMRYQGNPITEIKKATESIYGIQE